MNDVSGFRYECIAMSEGAAMLCGINTRHAQGVAYFNELNAER